MPRLLEDKGITDKQAILKEQFRRPREKLLERASQKCLRMELEPPEDVLDVVLKLYTSYRYRGAQVRSLMKEMRKNSRHRDGECKAGSGA